MEMDNNYRTFCSNLFRCLGEHFPSKSFVFSPTSVALALATLELGAHGQTHTELTRLFVGDITAPASIAGASIDELAENNAAEARLHKFFASVAKWPRIVPENAAYALEFANALYAHSGFPISPQFQRDFEKYYDGVIKFIDLTKSDTAAMMINNFVQSKTNNKIRNMISAEDIGDSDLILVNTSYFKGVWNTKFPKKMTTLRNFHVSHDVIKEVEMMQKTANFHYYENEQLQLLVLPYLMGVGGVGGLRSSNRAQMLILLPKPLYTTVDISAEIFTTNLVDTLRNKCQESTVEVHLPKFTVDFTCSLNTILPSMGVKLEKMNLARLSDVNVRAPRVGDLIHRAIIETDEAGTEAAAATVNVAISGEVSHDEIVKFVADHPFIFVIADVSKILFFGVVRMD